METLTNIAAAAAVNGWKVMLVGGAVRDRIMGKKEYEDYDLEFYGPNVEQLDEFLQQYGEVKEVGRSFGVFKVKIGEDEFDVSLPRTESKTGSGHKGFTVQFEALSPRQAAERRDFTINTLSIDINTDELHNDYGGLGDIERRILRHTSQHFIEDPLRVLRGFQFCGRFELTPDPKTVQLCDQLRPEYNTLPRERIWQEWVKWAEKSVKPSMGLEFLKDTKWVQFYPELEDLIGLEQEPSYHPEGSVWIHSCQTTDAMACLCTDGGMKGKDRIVLMFAALCHDLGKVMTTDINFEGRIISPGHPEQGELCTEMFMKSIGAPQEIIERVLPLVANHMMHLSEHSHKSVRRLSTRLGKATINELAYVITADSRGRGSLSDNPVVGLESLLELAKEVRVMDHAPKPLLKGRHLIDLGETPGPVIGEELDKAFQAQLDGYFSSETTAIEWYKDNK